MPEHLTCPAGGGAVRVHLGAEAGQAMARVDTRGIPVMEPASVEETIRSEIAPGPRSLLGIDSTAGLVAGAAMLISSPWLAKGGRQNVVQSERTNAA